MPLFPISFRFSLLLPYHHHRLLLCSEYVSLMGLLLLIVIFWARRKVQSFDKFNLEGHHASHVFEGQSFDKFR